MSYCCAEGERLWDDAAAAIAAHRAASIADDAATIATANTTYAAWAAHRATHGGDA